MCIYIANPSITTEQTSFASINHNVYTAASNKVVTCNARDQKNQDEEKITTNFNGSNISYIKHIGDKKYLTVRKS